KAYPSQQDLLLAPHPVAASRPTLTVCFSTWGHAVACPQPTKHPEMHHMMGGHATACPYLFA
ncbi:MAG: hypothetical protein K1V76_01490, partial [Candidatus Amulumruptor sp.]